MRLPPTAIAVLLALAGPVLAEGAAPAPASLDPAVRAALHAEIRSYLLANPEILTEMVALLEERRAAEAAAADKALVAANAGAIFDDGFSFVAGNPQGSVTVVEFLDYQCGFCRRAHPDLVKLVAADGDVRWIIKELPILGPGSELAARAAIATLQVAGPAAYADLNLRLMRLDGPVDDASLDRVLADAGLDRDAIRAGLHTPEVDRRLQVTRDLAQALAISGTPTFVIADRMLRGAVPLAEMAALVDALRPQ